MLAKRERQMWVDNFACILLLALLPNSDIQVLSLKKGEKKGNKKRKMSN